MKVGVAGLGRMGAAIAQRLIEVGHEVMVWNRNQQKTEPLADAGAMVAAKPSELAGRVETIITILTDAAAITSVYQGEAGLLEGDVTGKLFIEMSTVRPETEIALAEKVVAKGASLVECPVGGTVGPALTGKLSASPAVRWRISPAPSRYWTRYAAGSTGSAPLAPAPA
jgi:3-hydroxyisobutyrate dehydrogenase